MADITTGLTINYDEELQIGSLQKNSDTTPTVMATLQSEESNQYMIITDSEAIDIKSNILLPSGLRAYNDDTTTRVEYLTSSLSPMPTLTGAQLQQVSGGVRDGLLGIFIILGFGLLVKLFFNLLK